MRKRVEELIRESMILEPARPLVSASRLDITLKAGEPYRGSFRVGSPDGSRIRAYVVSDNHRIVIAKQHFEESSFNVVYGIDTTGLSAKDRVEGRICVMTDIGQAEVPVFAVVEKEKLIASSIEIVDIDSFVKLAKTNYREAFRLYTSDSFKSLLADKEEVHVPLYEGLSRNPVTYQHLEEFLVSAGKKQQVSISLDKQTKQSYRITGPVKDTLYIYKNTWGYVNVDISVQGDFIEVEKRTLNAEDFIGKVYGLEYVINPEKLSGAVRTGKIVIRTVYETLELEIEAAPAGKDEYSSPAFRKDRIFRLVSGLLDLFLKKTDYRTWYDNSVTLLEDLKEDKEDNFTRFAEIYMAYTRENYSRAIELLWDMKEGVIELKQPWERAAYLYLAKAVSLLPLEQRDISAALLSCYRQDPTCFLPMAFYLEEEKAKGASAAGSLADLEEAYEQGCSSPFMYLRAWEVLKEQESLLRRLSPFMIRVVNFALKHDLLTEGILLRAAFLSSNQKQFSPILYKIMADGYEKYPSRELLEAIVKYIIKGNQISPSCFVWYEKAVEADIRVTRLYEYYMETRPESRTEEFPLPVRLYFSYNSTLGERKKAYLYAGIIRYKDRDPVSYENYSKAMEEFARASFKKGLINENYAVLYQEFFGDSTDPEVAASLALLLFTCKLECDNPSIRKVIVCHPALNEEQEYVFANGRAYPNIYSDDACILLEDDLKRRFVTTIPYRLTNLMDRKKTAAYCAALGVWDTGMMLYSCGSASWQMDVTSANLLKLWKVAENPAIKRSYRDKIRLRLLDYFMNHADSEVAPYVEAMRENTYGWLDKVKTVSLLIRFGRFERAFALVNRMGYEKINLADLLALAGSRIRHVAGEENEEVLNLALYVFRRGLFDETVLSYLCRHAFLNIDESIRLWEYALSAGIDVVPLEERILLDSMFARVIPERAEDVLADFNRKSGNRMVSRAYLTYLSMESVLNDRRIQDSTADLLSTLVDSETVRVRYCVLAWLKYAAGMKKTDAEAEDRIRRLLEYCADNSLRFSFLKRLPSRFLQGYQMEDKVFVEERFPEGSKVTLYYRLEGAPSTGEKHWTGEPLKEMIPGLFSREFLLFYGERLYYYCEAESGGEIIKTGEKHITVTTMDMEGHTKYRRLNAIKAKISLIENVPVSDDVRKYMWQEACAGELFKIRKE
ncbi:MAG: hypothetical protein IJH99_08035 [Eubacterium sp.]|nr:hypothetical protein [Eubacterium sp.]